MSLNLYCQKIDQSYGVNGGGETGREIAKRHEKLGDIVSICTARISIYGDDCVMTQRGQYHGEKNLLLTFIKRKGMPGHPQPQG